MRWLLEFSDLASETDQLKEKPKHTELLGAGLMGEVGSILAEVKKREREQEAYPGYRSRLMEEFGDFLWYFTRLTSVFAPTLLTELDISKSPPTDASKAQVCIALILGGRVGELISTLGDTLNQPTRIQLLNVWIALEELSAQLGIPLETAAEENIRKTNSRWPIVKTYQPLFDEKFPEEEQLPRKLDFEFRECLVGTTRTVILRCNGLNVGDRVNDNIEDPDWYRYHDIFHFAHAVHTGWSPVMRALLRCKRKSRPKIDEAQDGARAIILDEAVAATVFSHAKELKFFDGIPQVDYDLLKSIRRFVEGFEVAQIPLWQWERAILDGYRVFRLLRDNHGGRVMLDLSQHTLAYAQPIRN